MTEIHFLADALGELIDDDAESAKVGVGPSLRDRVENPADSLNVTRHEILYSGTKNLHNDISPLISRAVNLAK